MKRILLTLFVAVAAAIGVLSMVDAPASAQTSTPPRWFDPVSSKEADVFRKVIEASYGPDDAKRATARSIIRRNLVRTVPRAVPYILGKGGLIGTAVGTWTVVGLELYYLPCWECSPRVERTGMEFSNAQGSRITYATVDGRSSGARAAVGYITYAAAYNLDGRGYVSVGTAGGVKSWRVVADPNTGEDVYTAGVIGGAVRPASYSGYSASVQLNYDYGCSSPCGPYAPVVYVRTSSYESPVPDGSYDVLALQNGSNVVVGTISSGDKVRYPTIDVGAATEAPSGSPTFSSIPTEGNAFINNVVADPQTKPLVDPMDVPEQEPDPDWDPNTDPFSPLFDPFEDPEGDPDDDGIPNKDDPDPEGDEDPDGDGDPNEHPVIAPWPQTDDPEEDGDPDETNPAPTPAPLPGDDPYADPDRDGEPNETDPDDDGDGVPDGDDPAPFDPGVPSDAPKGDPDGDGQPNETDPDDDGDGFPDTNDPSPYDPSQPGTDPNGDEDSDGVPNADDPAPNDKNQPEPNGDPDGDGIPNSEDPAPGDPNVPDQSSDQDQDGVPDFQDPAPNDKSQPDPTGDPDGDGVPNSEDPAPGDPNVPEGAAPGTCFAAPPRPKIDGPDGENYSSLFPFNLLILAVDTISALGAEPKAPPLPVLFPDAQAGYEPFSLTEFDTQAALVRRIFSVAGMIGALFMLYRLVSQSKEGD